MNILLVSPVPPVPPLAGDRQRTNLLNSALRSVGSVDLFICSQPGKLDSSLVDQLKDEWGLIDWFCEVSPSFFRRALAWLLPSLGYRKDVASSLALRDVVAKGGYDCIVVRYLYVALKVDALETGLPIFLDMDDYEPERHSSYASAKELPLLKRVLSARKSRVLRKLFARTLPRFQHVWGANIRDCIHPGLVEMSILPNIPFGLSVGSTEGQNCSPSVQPPNLEIFCATSYNEGNIRGLLCFCESVLPRLRRRYPNLMLNIVGSNLPPNIQNAFGQFPGVCFLGRVEDLTPYYMRCRVAIAPVLYGAGTSIKVLESFSHARPCVMNRFASRGLEDLPDEILSHLEVDNIEDMGEKLIHIIEGGVMSLGEECRRWVESSRSISRFNESVRLPFRNFRNQLSR